jgi:hypothetical protein
MNDEENGKNSTCPDLTHIAKAKQANVPTKALSESLQNQPEEEF